MKPLFHKVPGKPQNSFSIRHDVKPNFETIWHYHPEFELHYIVKGEGVRFIGDAIGNFSAGEMILLGENVPHTWRCKEDYFENNPALNVEAVVMHFLPDCLGNHFLQLPEAYLIIKLFEKAKAGMMVTGETKEKVAYLMFKILEASDLDRIILLLTILNTLGQTTEYTPITTAQGFYQSNEMEVMRLNNVCTYTLTNYKKDITLSEIAAISNLSVTSFCRYFKLMTKKTYYNFLLEIRISHACRDLVEGKLPTEVICFDCGFNNVTNFYRLFKKVTGLTPLEYKRKYRTDR